MGLAIVRHVARSAGIQVQVESSQGQGTRFTLTIPTAAVCALCHGSRLLASATDEVPEPSVPTWEIGHETH